MTRTPAEARRRSERSSERGSIVLGWLTRLVVVLGLVGIVGFDLVSYGVARLSATDQAEQVARAGATAWQTGSDVDAAYAEATQVAEDLDPGNVLPPQEFRASRDGGVSVRLDHPVPTLVARHLPWFRDHLVVTGRAGSHGPV